MGAVELAEERFFSGDWLDLLPGPARAGRAKNQAAPNGADQIAEFICSRKGFKRSVATV